MARQAKNKCKKWSLRYFTLEEKWQRMPPTRLRRRFVIFTGSLFNREFSRRFLAGVSARPGARAVNHCRS